MFTILVVASQDPALESLARSRPSIEILRASTADEAIEKLARNRRIDAVLVLGDDAQSTIREIREEEPAPPPIFTAGSGTDAETPAGTGKGERAVSGDSPAALVDAVIRSLG